MFKIKYLMILVCSVLLLSGTASADEYRDEEGHVVQSLGGGQYVSTSGKMMQVQDMGGGDYLTSSGHILEYTGAGSYVDSNSGSLFDMSNEGDDDNEHMDSF